MSEIFRIEESLDLDAGSTVTETIEMDISRALSATIYINDEVAEIGTYIFEVLISGIKDDGTAFGFMSINKEQTGQGCFIVDVSGQELMKVKCKKAQTGRTVDILVNSHL